MKISAEKIKKLRRMGLGEVMGRGQQEFLKLADRFSLAGTGEMNDSALYREFKTEMRNGSGAGTVTLLGDRLRTGKVDFPPPLAGRKSIVERMNSRFGPERDAIIARAEKALTGKFDLLGYTDLDFGDPVDWHLDPRTGGRVPFLHWSRIAHIDPIGGGDWKVFLEVQRQTHLVALGQAYWLTGDHRYVKGVVNHISSWIETNPVGIGGGWAGSLDVSFRSISWIWALSMCSDSYEMTNEFLTRAVKSLIEHGRHIEKYLSYYCSPNTHLTGEALGLVYLGASLPELRRAGAWRDLGLKILFDQLQKQVRDDGVYFEQSSYYHRYTADFYTHLFALIRANQIGLPGEHERMLRRKLESLFDHLMWIKRPDDTWPLFGDDDGGRLITLASRAGNDFRDTLAIGASIFNRGDWKYAAGEAPAEMLWMLGPEGVDSYDRLKMEAPEETSRAFKTSGYFVIRDGWERDSSFALIDCGRHGAEMGPCHAHSDALSIELALGGTTWLVDPASYVYGADPEARDWFRSTVAHNTAMVDGEDQSIPGTPFAWKTSANCSLVEFNDRGDSVAFEGWHDGYRRLTDPVTHTRSIVMVRSRRAVFVSDGFAARERHAYTIRYHFAPGCLVEVFDKRFEARMANGETLSINLFIKGKGLRDVRTEIEDGWVSTCYGGRTEAPVAVFTATGEGQIEFTTVILAGDIKDEGRRG